MTALLRHIQDAIRAGGPLSVGAYMRLVLTERDDSYYRNRDPIGAGGDFVTAPEVSQIFGELIGLWCADIWRQLGMPRRFALVELGPGRGTLMRDALRAARIVPGILEAACVELVEASAVLRDKQRDALRNAGAGGLAWRDDFGSVTAGLPAIVIANEFFDALPVRQFVRTGRGWQERCVGLDSDGGLLFGLAPDAVDERLVPVAVRDAAPGAIVELSPARAQLGALIGERIAQDGGALLAIDYGFAGPALGDTFQAIKAHAFADVLAQPGAADLTSHVDFTALGDAVAAAGARVLPVATQGAFLRALGGFERLTALKRGADTAQSETLERGFRRLTGDEAMGSLFKVLGAVAPATLQPAGFATS
jgi:SAM-dependent MidA family methyltransferase